MLDITSHSKWKISKAWRRDFTTLESEVAFLYIFHFHVSETIDMQKRIFKLCLTEIKSSTCFTESHWVKTKELSLVKGISKQRVDSMVSGKLLLEDEKVINVVEYSMEERCQHLWLYFFNHLIVVPLV